MKDLKILFAIGLLVIVTVLGTVIAYSSFANASRTTPIAYNYNAPAGYPNNNYGDSTYPTYPSAPNYPYGEGNGQPSYQNYPPGYNYPYSQGEREISPWGGE